MSSQFSTSTFVKSTFQPKLRLMKTYINTKKVYYALIAFGGLLLIAYIFILTFNFNRGDATTSGAIGDAFGGIAAPFIGSAGVLLTFLAFWVQYEANQRQMKVYEEQRKDIQRERFENKFYELLRLHKENVNEIEIIEAKLKGRACFQYFLKEVFGLHSIITLMNPSNESLFHLSEEDKIKFAWNLFLNGVTDRVNSKFFNANFYKPTDGNDHFNKTIEIAKAASGRWKDSFQGFLGGDGLFDKEFRKLPPLYFIYTPFEGSGSQLGHYFRHFYQTVKFIDQSEVLDEKEKMNFIKTLRAQLSNHEQAIIYINSLVNPGKKLWKDYQDSEKISRYMLDYKLIKNLPFHLVDFTINPKHKFKEELKEANPDKDNKWLNEKTFQAFEELENLMSF